MPIIRVGINCDVKLHTIFKLSNSKIIYKWSKFQFILGHLFNINFEEFKCVCYLVRNLHNRRETNCIESLSSIISRSFSLNSSIFTGYDLRFELFI